MSDAGDLGMGGAGVLVARARRGAIELLGKGLGFAVGFYLCSIGVFATALYTRDAALVGALTAPLGMLAAAYYGGGGWKAHQEAKNGATNGQPAS